MQFAGVLHCLWGLHTQSRVLTSSRSVLHWFPLVLWVWPPWVPWS